MSTKDMHVLNFWHAKLSECECAVNRHVSAGEVARYVGQNIGTAKRYLKRLEGEGVVVSNNIRFPNGVFGNVYGVRV